MKSCRRSIEGGRREVEEEMEKRKRRKEEKKGVGCVEETHRAGTREERKESRGKNQKGGGKRGGILS